MKIGARMKAPKGFAERIAWLGRPIDIVYVASLNHRGRAFDGYLQTDRDVIYIRRKGRSAPAMRATILHEIVHYSLAYYGKRHGEQIVEGEQEEAIALALEAHVDAFLKANPWFRALYGGSDADKGAE